MKSGLSGRLAVDASVLVELASAMPLGVLFKDLLKEGVVEADTGFAIRVLRDAVDFVTVSVRQLRGRFWARVEIDKAILKILGFNEEETNNY